MYKLTTSFPYILNRVGVRIGDLFSDRLKADDLSLNMYRALAGLWEKGEQNLNQLAEFTSVEPSTLSRMVGTLVRRKLVLRQRTEQNARTVQIALTPKGKSLVEHYIPIALEFEAVALKDLTASEAKKIKEDLLRIYKNTDFIIEKYTTKPAGRRRTKP